MQKIERNPKPIEYTEDFKIKVMKAYPEWAEMKKWLDLGSEMVGRGLDDSGYLENGKIYGADLTNIDGIASMVKYVQLAQDKRRLYSEWSAIYDAHHGIKR
jgi:hypothetical protein